MTSAISTIFNLLSAGESNAPNALVPAVSGKAREEMVQRGLGQDVVGGNLERGGAEEDE
jgi:hypothetical protein